MNGVSAKTRRSMFIAAGIIFAAALIWLAALESHSYVRAACRRINEFGYRLSPGDMYSQSFGADTSIGDVIEVDLSEAIELSRRCGFDSDIHKKGSVELLLCRLSEYRVMYIYLLDRKPELVFIEDLSAGKLFPINQE